MVFDPGHYSFKAGFAGEDSPKAEIPSFAGCQMVADENAMDLDSVVLNRVSMKKKYFIDSTSIYVPRKDTEMINYLKDGMSKLESLNNAVEINLATFRCHFSRRLGFV